jgi:pullulanase/glycogen debranching enzyme
LRGGICAAKISRMAAKGSETRIDPLWYKDAVIYELHVKTFCDSDGDGMGDFRGLIEKLDYLQELGITAIWLLPIISTLIPTSARSRISARFLMRRMNAICELSPNW